MPMGAVSTHSDDTISAVRGAIGTSSANRMITGTIHVSPGR